MGFDDVQDVLMPRRAWKPVSGHLWGRQITPYYLWITGDYFPFLAVLMSVVDSLDVVYQRLSMDRIYKYNFHL